MQTSKPPFILLCNRFINQFDFPVINERYRGKRYCVTYGWSAFDYSRTALVKKNVCDPTQVTSAVTSHGIVWQSDVIAYYLKQI